MKWSDLGSTPKSLFGCSPEHFWRWLIGIADLGRLPGAFELDFSRSLHDNLNAPIHGEIWRRGSCDSLPHCRRGHMTGKGGLPQRPVTAVPALGLEEDPNPHPNSLHITAAQGEYLGHARRCSGLTSGCDLVLVLRMGMGCLIRCDGVAKSTAGQALTLPSVPSPQPCPTECQLASWDPSVM